MTSDFPLRFEDFARVVEDTFDRPRGSIAPATFCADVPGWDSLGHSVLLSRLDRRFALNLAEEDASPAETVGELFDQMRALRRAEPT